MPWASFTTTLTSTNCELTRNVSDGGGAWAAPIMGIKAPVIALRITVRRVISTLLRLTSFDVQSRGRVPTSRACLRTKRISIQLRISGFHPVSLTWIERAVGSFQEGEAAVIYFLRHGTCRGSVTAFLSTPVERFGDDPQLPVTSPSGTCSCCSTALPASFKGHARQPGLPDDTR